LPSVEREGRLSPSPSELPEILREFLGEAHEILRALESGLVRLEREEPGALDESSADSTT